MGVTIGYKGSTIAEMETAGSKILKTGGCYCEGDVVVTYTPGTVTDDRFRRWDITTTGDFASAKTYLVQDSWLAEHREDAGLCVAIVPKFAIANDSTRGQLGIFLGVNETWAVIGTTEYKTVSAYNNRNGSIAPRMRTFGLTKASDIGDVGIEADGRLYVIATAAASLAPGDYCVTAWLK